MEPAIATDELPQLDLSAPAFAVGGFEHPQELTTIVEVAVFVHPLALVKV